MQSLCDPSFAAITAATAHNGKVREAMDVWSARDRGEGKFGETAKAGEAPRISPTSGGICPNDEVRETFDNPAASIHEDHDRARSGLWGAIDGKEFMLSSRQWRAVKGRYLAALAVAIFGLFASGFAFVAVSNWEHRVSELKLLELASNDQQKLNFDLKSATDVLYTLRAFYQATDHIATRSEFQAFAKDLRGRLVGLRNTGWAKRVPREDREAFEESMRLEGFPDFMIWERDANGAKVRAGDRAEYFPILYPDPEQYTSQILGFDIASEPIRADAVRRALISKKPAATPPINLITKSEPDGFMTFLPVEPRSDVRSKQPGSTEGLMYGVFGTGPMVENILGSQTKPSGLDIYLYNPRQPHGKRLIYWYSSPSRRQRAPAPDEEALLRDAHWIGGVHVADQEWSAIFSPSDPRVVDAESWRPLAVLVVALATTSSIVTYLLVSLRRTLHLEFLTASLRKTTDHLRRESQKVTHLAHHDPLTGLANRLTFKECLLGAFEAAEHGGPHFAVMYMDLDHFKDVNDTLGHPCGDRLLQITAERLKPIVGDTDIVARLGGDEFAILASATSNAHEIARLATRINAAMAETYDLGANEAHVSASLGISLFVPNVGSPDDMMMQADLALYEAKRLRGGYYFHSTELDAEIRERVMIANELQTAIKNGELELYYQPQIEVTNGRIVGMEALIRWNYPKRGLTMPAAFISIAERSGVIHDLGRWALEESCRQIQRWRSIGIRPPVLAINVSAVQFKGSVSLDQQVRQAMARFAIDPSGIEIELTESALVEITEAHTHVIQSLRELGIRVTIDDFGTGYSSLEFLQGHKVDKLKVAQQFVSKVGTDDSARAIVRATLVLARELGMEAVVEGVETAEQLAFVMSAGCSRVQGYYYGHPVQESEANVLLQNGVIKRELAFQESRPNKLSRASA